MNLFAAIAEFVAHARLFMGAQLRVSLAWARAHKLMSGTLAVIAILLIWFAYGKLSSTSGIPAYALGTARTGTLIVSVTGTGQVSASNQLSLAPQASGKIVYIGAKDGQYVQKGTLIAEVDPTAAQKAVRDAEANLESAQISFQKLTEPADQLSLTQEQNALASAKSSLTSAYSSAVADLATVYLNLPGIVTGLTDVELGTQAGGSSQWNIDYYQHVIDTYESGSAQSYRDQAYNDYLAAKSSYDSASNDYKSVNLSAGDTNATESLLTETYRTLQLATDAAKSANALLQHYSDLLTQRNLPISPAATSQITNLASYTAKLTSYTSSLLSDTNTIANGKQTVTADELSLQKLQSGADPLDVQSSRLSVQKAQNALQDAQDALADYYVTAPFNGTVGISATPYQQVGSGTVVATLVTAEQFAQITLNEVDAATVKSGDKATLTFDALPDLTIAGEVGSISPVGTVSQGVVSYAVKIAFATQDARVKPGMSVSAEIDTDVVQNALLVPGSAVHSSSTESYVLAFKPPLQTSGNGAVQTTLTPVQVPVTPGLSNDTDTQILSGLSAGDQIVVRTTTGSAGAATQAPSIFSAAGAGTRGASGGAGAARALGR